MTKPVLLTSMDAALRMGISQRQVQRLAKAGLLPIYAYGPRNTLLFRLSDVDRSPTSLA